jgi:hypothetical protein
MRYRARFTGSRGLLRSASQTLRSGILWYFTNRL